MTAVLDDEYLAKFSEGISLERPGIARFLALLDPVYEYITFHTFILFGGFAFGMVLRGL